MSEALSEAAIRAAGYESARVEAALSKIWDVLGFDGLRNARLAVETHERSGMRFHLKTITMAGRRVWEGAYEEETPLVFTWRERWLSAPVVMP